MIILSGRFALFEEVGAGAYGTVCRAMDLQSEPRRQVAVKTVDLDVVPKERREFASTMIEKELEIMRALNHPSVLRAIDVIVCDSRRHIVLEWCEGPDLQQVLDARGALNLDEAREVLRQTLQALRHLHGRGIIHRDVKPANVMFVEAFADARAKASARRLALQTTNVRDRQVKLIDFGLARLLPHSTSAARRDSTPGNSAHAGGSKHAGGRGSGSYLFKSATSFTTDGADEAVTGLRRFSQRQSPGNSGHGGVIASGLSNAAPAAAGSQAGGSQHGGGLKGLRALSSSPGMVRMGGGSRHGGSRHGASRHGASRHGASRGASRHGADNSVQRFDWLAHLEERFEVSAHGSQAFAPPEMQDAWRRHFCAPDAPDAPASAPGATDAAQGAGVLRGLTARDAWMIDVFSLGLMLRYMLTGREPLADGSEAEVAPLPTIDELDAFCGCFAPRRAAPPLERIVRDVAELDEAAADLLTRMTAKHAHDRLDIQEALDHKWLQLPPPAAEGRDVHWETRGLYVGDGATNN